MGIKCLKFRTECERETDRIDDDAHERKDLNRRKDRSRTSEQINRIEQNEDEK